ncbi:hypothetical protein [Labedella endophytica]|uniref:Uncharacterized protein n=1 Tax=Labedella endophytica TaxID=1523160 RepID=A0A433JSD6_9MICO|nr:hypothetical protein [Labedella endophytica]RUR01302.1 hypothetical protein ELQ94_07270 [Labedella endophytica]
MRWDDLFDDLESQLASERDAEERDARADDERLRVGRLLLRERLEAHATGSRAAAPLAIELAAGDRVVLRPTTFGRDWISGETVTADARGRGCIVPIASITAVTVPTAEVPRTLAALPATGGGPRVSDRIGLPFVLRDLCRRRVSVDIHTGGGVRSGTIDRAGRDHVDLALHERGVARRQRDVAHVLLIPFAAVHRIML